MLVRDVIARSMEVIPADVWNNNVVQDAQWRIREALRMCGHLRPDEADREAPSYLLKVVANLDDWIVYVRTENRRRDAY